MLIVGATSFIGRHITNELIQKSRYFEATARFRSRHVFSLDLSLLDQFDFSPIRSSTSIVCALSLIWLGVKKT